MSKQSYERQVKSIQRSMTIAKRAMRNKSLIDKACAFLVNRSMRDIKRKPFMVDEIVDNDFGYDPDELARYERGDTD